MALAFGTSGLRGLATDLTDEVCIRFARAFVGHYKSLRQNAGKMACVLAGDLRESTPRIMAAVTRGLHSEGFDVLDAGRIPTPALAYECVTRKLPGVMVTGSHIPADRNGIKFYLPWGEILKRDELEIFRLEKSLPASAGNLSLNGSIEQVSAEQNFISRYVDFFGTDCLNGLKVVFFEHSSVAREVAPKILKALGAQVIRVGRSETFVSIDTEALENVQILTAYVKQHKADALLSTDGDGDRPLLLDKNGSVVRGDQIGILAARALMSDSVSTPLSTSTALEKTGWFGQIQRCKIGSSFVVEEMEKSRKANFQRITGFEANGGFLLGSEVQGRDGNVLKPLVTRDSMLPVLLCLVQAKKEKKTLSQFVQTLPLRFTASDLIRNFPVEKSRQVLQLLQKGGVTVFDQQWADQLGKIQGINETDGYRVTFENGEILHFRPSGNAPEFRIYSESDTESHAMEINRLAKEWVSTLATF